jgi:tight adherence protein C
VNASLSIVQTYLGHAPLAALGFVVLIGVAVFALSMGVSAFVVVVADPVRRRLGRLGGGQEQSPGSAASMADTLRPLFPYLIPSKEKERSRVSRLLMYAGFRSPTALPLFYGAKALFMLGLPLGVFLTSPFFPRITGGQLLIAAAVMGFLGSIVPSVWLDYSVKSRQRELRVAFPDALDLLVVCVEAGLGLAPALQRVADDLMISYPELGGELSLVNAEMRAGVERSQALKNLAERTGLDDIRGLVALLVQTLRFGTGIADALRVYSEEFRDKRMQAAEEAAAKIGTKMIFPLTLCLFPSFFLVAVGPAVVRLVEAFRTLDIH